MSDWKEYKLSDFIDFNPSTPLKKGSEAIKVGMEHLTPNGKKINEWELSEYNGGAKFKNGDTLLARITPCLENGKIGYVDISKENEVAFGSTEFLVMREKSGISDSQFIFYFAFWSEFRDLAVQLMTGTSGRQRIETDVLKIRVFNFPDLSTQRAIAEILSSLDDKIDLLARQNTTFEALVQAYFRQWFVEEANEDWDIVQIKKFGEIICGKTPSTKKVDYFGEDICFLKIPDMYENTFVFKTTDGLSLLGKQSQKNKIIPPMSICVSCIATVGLVVINAVECQTNQQINSIILNDNRYLYYLYLFLKNYKDELTALGSGGTTVGNVNTTLFSQIECYDIPDDLLLQFNNIAKPLFDKIFSNTQQIQTLQKLRDTLLPKLISGEIKVKGNL